MKPGIAAVDVGCGVLGVLHLLAERIGTRGRVVGLDREPRILEAGPGLAEQRGLDVEFVEADATASGLPADAYDLVHARTLLLKVSNPQEILAEMIRIARPGGLRALRDMGLEGVRVRATARVTQVGDFNQTFLLTIAGLVRDVIIQGANITSDEFDFHSTALRTHLATPGTLTCQPLMWQAWGQVPV